MVETAAAVAVAIFAWNLCNVASPLPTDQAVIYIYHCSHLLCTWFFFNTNLPVSLGEHDLCGPASLPINMIEQYISRINQMIRVSDNLILSLQWRHNGRDGVSNHQSHHCLLNRLFRRRSKKTSKLRVTGLCAKNSPVTGEFPAQKASNAENVSIWWRHHSSICH